MRNFLGRQQRVFALLFGVALASCNGGASTGGGGSPLNGVPNVLPPANSQAAFPDALTPLSAINTYPGAINGETGLFRPKRGDSKAGGQGQVVDGVPCLPTMSNDYHIHVFLGIVYNGKLVAVPHAIGMKAPAPQVNGWTNSAQCFYEIHTHDSSGIVHVEVNKFLPITSVYYDLPDVFDIWGVRYGKGYFGPFQGPIHVFVGNVAAPGQLTVSTYHEFKKKISKLGLRTHEVIWYEIGSQYFTATQLPPVTFYMEY